MENKIHGMKSFKYIYGIHLLLLSVFFVLHGYVDFVRILLFMDVLQMLCNYLLATCIVLAFSYFFYRNFSKAAILTFFIMAYHFFFGAIHDLGKKILGGSFFTSYKFILPFSLSILIFLILFLRKSRFSFYRLHRFLTVLFIVLIVTDLIFLVNKLYNLDHSKNSLSQADFTRCNTCSKPDIYFIVLDGYAGNYTLMNTLNFDNSSFEYELKNKGFHLVHDSKSNYNSTPFSIASTFNVDYLPGFSAKFENRKDLITSLRMINKNKIAAFFNSEGYKIISHSVFNFHNIGTEANDFTLFAVRGNLIYNQTFLSRVKNDIGNYVLTKLHLQPRIDKSVFSVLHYNNYIYTSLIKEAQESSQSPRFVYTHFVMPHWPCFFSEDGKLNNEEILMDFSKPNTQAYLGYLKYCNKKISTLIDQIFFYTKKKAIIVLISDHGLREFEKPVDPKYFFYNLSSIYLPSQNYKAFYDGMSNVNLFRSLLNTQFNQSLPVLKDSTVLIK